jgi:hypothetical protein
MALLMIFIVTFGLLMMLLSLRMIKNPQAFSGNIIKFSEQPYFHVFEILSRLIFGLIFIYYAPLTSAEVLNTALGYLMIFTSIFLLLLGGNKHRAFALWSAIRFCATFRFYGVFSFILGVYIIYSTIY